MNRLNDIRKDTDEKFNKLMGQFDEIFNKIADVNCHLYRDKLIHMDEEELESEFADRIGNELGEFEWMMYHKGKSAVIEYLYDNYEVEQYRWAVGP